MTWNALKGLFVAAATAALASAASAHAQAWEDVNDMFVVSVRVYVSGSMHIDFKDSVSQVCGARVRVPIGAGGESIRALAVAAMMSGRRVSVQVGSERVGNYCELNYLRLEDS